MHMLKPTFALIASALLATSSAFAGGACCADISRKNGVLEIYAQLNLSPEQKSKLDRLPSAVAKKTAARKESMEKFFSSAKEVLSPEQYAQLKTECAQMQHSEKKS